MPFLGLELLTFIAPLPIHFKATEQRLLSNCASTVWLCEVYRRVLRIGVVGDSSSFFVFIC